MCGKVSHVIASPLLEGFARDSTTVYFPVTETEKVPDVGATRGRHSRRGGALRNPTTYASSDAMLHQAPELLGLLQQLKPLLTSVRGHLVYS